MKRYMLARQPIFTKTLDVYGYELLHRSGSVNAFDTSIDGDTATRSVVANMFATFGERNILDGKLGFVNFTQTLLLSHFVALLNPADFVIEVLETVSADPELLARLADLHRRGFIIALDDYISDEQSFPFLPYVDIVKVDFQQLTENQRRTIAYDPRLHGKRLLAEKVETIEEFEAAVEMGYTLFQGYFFARPTVFSKPMLTAASSTYMRAVRELLRPSPNFAVLANIIRPDVILTYKLLQHVNTVQYEHPQVIRSIKQAIVQMGVRRTYRWLLLTLMRDSTYLNNSELPKIALIRGLFCESLCSEIGLPFYQDEAYIVGMFSIIDTMVQGDLRELLQEVSLSQAVQDALLNRSNVLYRILTVVIAYESADWELVRDFAKLYNLSCDTLTSYYENAVCYADLALAPPEE